MTSPPVLRYCPACSNEVLASEWLCPSCEYVLDTGFLGNAITNDAPPPPPGPPAGAEPAITFVIGGPRPKPKAFSRRRALQPVVSTLAGGLSTTFVQQWMHFDIPTRYLESPFDAFLLEAWTAFIMGRPALIALPSLRNGTLSPAPARDARAIDTQVEGLCGTASSFQRKGLPGALVFTADGRTGFAQPLVAGVRLRDLRRATEAEGNRFPEDIAIAVAAAVDRARRGDPGTNPTGWPRDAVIGFDGTIGIVRWVHASAGDSVFSSWSSDPTVHLGPGWLRGLVGKQTEVSAELHDVLALEGDDFAAALQALEQARGDAITAAVASVARGVFPDHYDASRRASEACEDLLLEPLVFPPLVPMSGPDITLPGGLSMTATPQTVGNQARDLRWQLTRTQRRLPTTVEVQQLLKRLDADGLDAAEGRCWVDDAPADVRAEPRQVYVQDARVLQPDNRPCSAAFLVHDPVPWPDLPATTLSSAKTAT